MGNNDMAICLWYDYQAEEAAKFYTSIFKNSEIGAISRFGKEGFEHHGKPEGTAMSVTFKLNEINFIALNGGPIFKFSEAVSIVIYCENQEEIDHYWYKLSDGGEESQCGWLKDKFGVSWQITPKIMSEYLTSNDVARKSRVLTKMFQMKKFEIAELTKAYLGE